MAGGRAAVTPFGGGNRSRLIAEFFSERGEPMARTAWKDVYRLLLWIDPTTGLAHCYESDKAQPGKPWYARSVAFHGWLAGEFGTTPAGLGGEVDWLFRRILSGYLAALTAEQQRRRTSRRRRLPYQLPAGFPLPGADPEFQRIVEESLRPFLSGAPGPEVYEALANRIRVYWQRENKRKNLLGEGFEDVLAEIVTRVSGGVQARTRTGVAQIEGFAQPGRRDKTTKVDLVLTHPAWQVPALVNVKWSFRADREDQLWNDFRDYVRHDQAGEGDGFDHFLITNEFDPARLNSVCDQRESNNNIFKKVVHINTGGLTAAYADAPGPVAADQPDLSGVTGPAGSGPAADTSRNRVLRQIETGRLIGLSEWLAGLETPAAP